jgi:hypothetical protein
MIGVYRRRAAGEVSSLDRVDAYGPSPVNDGSFTLRLAMAGAPCPDCEEVGEPGLCESCGAEVPQVEGLSEIAVARSAALSSPRERAIELQQGWHPGPLAGAQITGDQFAGAFLQSKILERFDEAELACQRLSCHDLDDSAALGTSVRGVVLEELRLLEELRALCLELATFDVVPPQPELRRNLLEAGMRIAEMLLCFLETITAQTVTQVREGEARLQEAISRRPRAGELEQPVIELLASADLDARIALAVGKAGTYLDESGFIDLSRIFGAYSGEGGPYQRSSKAATSYFRHLLPAELDASAGSFLILAAVNIASLDGPLRAHRCAAAMASLIRDAAALDRGAVAVVLERSVREGPKLFAAASRVRMGMALIRRVSELEDVDEQLILREVMSSYLEIAESAFRSNAWAVLNVQAVLDGKEPSEEDPPMLGSLLQRLGASNSELALTLAEAADADLRNAAGHAQYRWDSETEEVEDLQTGQRWSVDELEARTEALNDSVIGVDAGYLCGVTAAEIEVRPTDSDQDPNMRRLLLEAAFAVAGYELTELSQDGATATVTSKASASLPSLMTAVASQSALVTDVDGYRVISAASGRVLVDVAAERMLASTKGSEEMRDLEMIRCFTDSEIRTGASASEALGEGLVVQTKVVAGTALHALAFEGPTLSVVARIRGRSQAVLDYLDQHPGIPPKAAEAGRRRLGRIIACTFSLERAEPKALNHLLRGIRAACSWADRQGISWPPEGKVD